MQKKHKETKRYMEGHTRRLGSKVDERLETYHLFEKENLVRIQTGHFLKIKLTVGVRINLFAIIHFKQIKILLVAITLRSTDLHIETTKS